MLFQKRVDRALDTARHKEAARKDGEAEPALQPEEPELSELTEKGDTAAMMISALLVFLPAAAAALLILALVGFLIV